MNCSIFLFPTTTRINALDNETSKTPPLFLEYQVCELVEVSTASMFSPESLFCLGVAVTAWGRWPVSLFNSY